MRLLLQLTKEILLISWAVEQALTRTSLVILPGWHRKEDTLVNDGFCPVDFAVTGMTWSAFRPSDDCCQYSYLIPSNMFAVVVLGYVQEIFATLNEIYTSLKAKRLQAGFKHDRNYAYTTNSKGEKNLCLEVDGQKC